MPDADGSYGFAEANERGIEDATTQDVASLRRSEANYRAMFDALDEGFCILERAITSIPGQLDFRYVAAKQRLRLSRE